MSVFLAAGTSTIFRWERKGVHTTFSFVKGVVVVEEEGVEDLLGKELLVGVVGSFAVVVVVVAVGLASTPAVERRMPMRDGAAGCKGLFSEALYTALPPPAQPLATPLAGPAGAGAGDPPPPLAPPLVTGRHSPTTAAPIIPAIGAWTEGSPNLMTLMPGFEVVSFVSFTIFVGSSFKSSR